MDQLDSCEYFSCGSNDSNQFTSLTDTWNEYTPGIFKGTVKQRSHANARERYRTHSVNSAFTTLRLLIPTEPKNRKLSKIETLRLAKSYIAHLNALLVTDCMVKQPCLQRLKNSNTSNSTSKVSRKLNKLNFDSQMIITTNFSTEMDKQDRNQEFRANICTFCVSYRKQ